MVEEEIGELTAKMKEFLRIVELVQPERFITAALQWCGLGRPMASREKMLRAFFMKAVYDLPTTKVLIENLETNPSLRRLCGWEYRAQVPSEATFSRAFKEFAEKKLLDVIHDVIVSENYTEKVVGHASMDSTAIAGREKSCRKNAQKKELKAKKKRGRKSKAELAAMAEGEIAEIKTRRLELQPRRSLTENLADLPLGCDWGGKQQRQDGILVRVQTASHAWRRRRASGGDTDFGFAARQPSCNSINANDGQACKSALYSG
jgi:hypothetical protein